MADYSLVRAVDIHGTAYSTPAYDSVNERITFDTGDNRVADLYVDNGNLTDGEQDVFIQADHFGNLSYPSNATDAIPFRVSALNTSSTHEYVHFSRGTYNPSPACAIDSWSNPERNALCGGISPPVYWAFNDIETWAVAAFGTNVRFWRDSATTFGSPVPAGRTLLLSTNALSAPQPGYLGLAAAQSRGWWDNLIVRRFTDPEPLIAVGVEETPLDPDPGGDGDGPHDQRAKQLPETGFAPHQMTALPKTPSFDLFTPLGSLRLLIPTLSVDVPILGVPQQEGFWDTRWLNMQAGYLEGTSFPTTSGNTALTGHVYLDNGLPGPFHNLQTLSYGNTITIQAWGQEYLYSVIAKEIVAPWETRVLDADPRSANTLTLITCSGFDAATHSYRARQIVSAILVDVHD